MLEEIKDGWWMGLSACGVVLLISFLLISIYCTVLMRKRNHSARIVVTPGLQHPPFLTYWRTMSDKDTNDNPLLNRPDLIRHLSLYDRVGFPEEFSQRRPISIPMSKFISSKFVTIAETTH